MDLDLIGSMEVGWDSNVDNVYPAEKKSGVQDSDFYWMPGLSLRSESVALRPSTTLSLSGAMAYQDYFVRNDLDSEIYNLAATIQTTHPRLTLAAMGSMDYSVDSSEHEYVPGGAVRDPTLTHEVGLQANWNYRILRLDGRTSYSRERHDLVEFYDGNKDETKLSGTIYLDLFSWGSLYYTWERTETDLPFTGENTTKIDETVGLAGAIPLDLLRHPHVTYAFGFTHESKTTTTEEEGREKADPSWKPTHSITVADEFDLTKTVNLSFAATWQDTWDDTGISIDWPGQHTEEETDEVTFQYNIVLSQRLGPRADHALVFTQEPESTFGSTTDTKSTSYGYKFNARDVIIYNLGFRFGAAYEEKTPLGEADALTEETTKFDVGLTHTRALTKQLTRILSYQYTWEDSNLQEGKAKDKHLVVYGLSYRF